MTTTIINAKVGNKFYTVTPVFNMVMNYHFIDKAGVHHLVDGEDILEWFDGLDVTDEGHKAKNDTEMAIAYARYYASEVEDGVFWWKVKEVCKAKDCNKTNIDYSGVCPNHR